MQFIAKCAFGLRRVVVPGILLIALIGGVSAAYATYRPALAAAVVVESDVKNLAPAELNSIVRLRGTMQAITDDKSTITVGVSSPYDRSRTYTLTLRLDAPDTATDISVGQRILIDVRRAEGPLHAYRIYASVI